MNIFHNEIEEKNRVAADRQPLIWYRAVTVHTPLSRKVFWHEYAKIPRHTSQNSIAAGNLVTYGQDSNV